MRLDVTLIADRYFRNGVLLTTKTHADKAKNCENTIMWEIVNTIAKLTLNEITAAHTFSRFETFTKAIGA